MLVLSNLFTTYKIKKWRFSYMAFGWDFMQGFFRAYIFEEAVRFNDRQKPGTDSMQRFPSFHGMMDIQVGFKLGSSVQHKAIVVCLVVEVNPLQIKTPTVNPEYFVRTKCPYVGDLRPFVRMKFLYSFWPLRILWLAFSLFCTAFNSVANLYMSFSQCQGQICASNGIISPW